MTNHTLEGADKIRRVSSGVIVGRTTAGEGRAELLTPSAARSLLAVQTAGEVAALYYNKTEVDSLLTAKANASHGHIIADVTGLSTALNGIQSDIVTLATTSVPKTTTLTINGTAQDLTANRSWTVGDLRSDGTYNNPAWLNQLAWSKITGITGVPNGSKYLRDDGSWQTLDLSPYLTTAAAALAYVPFTGATVAVNLGTQSLSAGAITASGTVIAATKILFSGTTSTECGVINATGTRLIWGRNSTSAALMTQSLNENAGGSGFTFRRGEGLSWSGSTSSSEGGGQTAYFFSEAANTYNFRNGLSAQSLEIENTYTSSTTREFLRLRGVAGANFEFGPSNGSIGGTLRGLTIGGYVNGSSTITPWLTFTNGGVAAFNVAATVTASSFTSDYGNFTNPSFIIGASSQGFGASGSTLYGRMSSSVVWAATASVFRVGASQVVGWSSTGDAQASADTGLARNAAGVVEVNNGTVGAYRDLISRAITASNQITTPSMLLSGNIAAPAWTTSGVGIAHNVRTLTDTTSAGTVAAAYTNFLGGNTIAASNAVTFTDYASLYLGNPIAGTNVTITNALSLITAGSVRFGGGATFVNGSGVSVGRISQFNNSFYIDTLQNGAIFFRTGFGTSSPFTLSGDGITGGNGNNLINIHYGTSSQTLRLYTTYTSTTNGEYLQIRGVAGANFEIGPSNGSAGGTLRGLTLGGYSNGSSTITPWMAFDNTGMVAGPKTTAWSISSGTPDQAAATQAGNNLTIQASSAVAGSSTNGAAAGGSVFIYAGSGTRFNTGTAAGGSITIKPGAGSISGGTPGALNLTGADGNTQTSAGDVYVRGGTATSINNNLNHGSIYLITSGADSYFYPGVISMTTGFGSRNTNANGAGFNGGAYSFTSGYGGAADLGGGTKIGGNGGAFTFTTGVGGAASSGTTNSGGNGGAYSITTGNGGAATGTAATGGNGGAINLTAGNGGAGAVTNGNGGSITLTAGVAGGGAGTAGVAGTLAFNGASVFTSQSAAAIPVRINGAASQSGNLLEVRDSGGSIGFMVTSGWVVTANRSGGSPNGSFAASETSSGYAFQGGWGGMRANSGTAATGNLLQSPYGWTLSCGSGYGVDIVNSTNAQTLRLFNTFTSTTVNEFLKLAWNANVAEIGTVKGGSGGSARDLVLQTDGTTRMTFGAAGTATVNTTLVTSTTALINSGSQAFNSSFHLVSWNGGCLGWASTGTVTTSSSLDTALKRVSAGLIEINNGTAGAYRDLILRNLRMSAPAVPATATSTGSEGQVSWDSNYVYVCVATDSWKRAALSSW